MNKKSTVIVSKFPRKKIREIIVQILYSLDIGTSDSTVVQVIMGELAVTKRLVTTAFEEASLIYEKRIEIDPILMSAAQNTPFGQITCLEKNIMRLAYHEFLSINRDASKRNMIITEAIRLTKKFSSPESSKFINAVLDAVFYSRGNASDEKTETSILPS